MICSGNVVSLQGTTYKVMHVVCSVTCWLLPWIPVGVVLGSKSTSYLPWNMRLCFPLGSGGTGFFTTTFITVVSQGVGCTCLFFVVYKLFMVIEKAGTKVRPDYLDRQSWSDWLILKLPVCICSDNLVPRFSPKGGREEAAWEWGCTTQMIWDIIVGDSTCLCFTLLYLIWFLCHVIRRKWSGAVRLGYS